MRVIIYVDAARGDNANDGRTPETAVADIETGLRRLAEARAERTDG